MDAALPTATTPLPSPHGAGCGTPRRAPSQECRICSAPTTPGWARCTSCRDVAVSLGRPLVPVTAIAQVTASHPLYRMLRQYKSGEPGVAARQAARLARTLAAFAAARLLPLEPEGLWTAVVVPSGGGRPPPHPLARVVAAAPGLPPVADVLGPGTRPPAHRRPAVTAYQVTGQVAGRRILLLDDVFTTGAHLQSAAAVLLDGGAAEVRAIVFARFVKELRDRPHQRGAPRFRVLGAAGVSPRLREPRGSDP